jgi:hypothetical protein
VCKSVKEVCTTQDEGELPVARQPGPYTKEIVVTKPILNEDGRKVGTHEENSTVDVPMEVRVIFHDFGHYSVPLPERIARAIVPSCCEEPVFLVNKETDTVVSEVQRCAMPIKYTFQPLRPFLPDKGDHVTNKVGQVQMRHTLLGRYPRCFKGEIFVDVYNTIMNDKFLTALRVLDQNGRVKPHINGAIARVAMTFHKDEAAINARVFMDTIQHAENQLVVRQVAYGKGTSAPLD